VSVHVPLHEEGPSLPSKRVKAEVPHLEREGAP
jgi:hypothetical protein